VDIVGQASSRDRFKQYLMDLAKEYALHPASVKDCLAPTHLPKMEKIDNCIFMLIRYYDDTCNENADTVQELTNKIAIFITDNYILTIHRVDTLFIQLLRERWEEDWKDRTQGHILNFLLDKTIDTFQLAIRLGNIRVDKYEIGIFEHKPEIIKGLYHIKRQASVLKRMTILLQTIVRHKSKEESLKSPATTPYNQDLQENTDTTLFQAEELHENANNLLNLHLSLASHRTNELMKILTMFSVCFIPLTFIAGVYGMNFKHMPELEWIFGYPLVLSVMLILGLSIGITLKNRKTFL